MPPVTAANHGPAINAVIWIIMAPTIIVSLVKVYTKWTTVRILQRDDIAMLAAMLLAVGQVVATSSEVNNGLGQHQETLPTGMIESFFLSRYVADILYVLTIFASKLTGLYFFVLLVGLFKRQKVVELTIYFIYGWMFVALFVVAFQCQVPMPWLKSSDQCINKNAFWIVNLIVDILTQLLVSIYPIWLLRNLQATKAKKRIARFAFSPNVLTLPLSIVRIISLTSPTTFSLPTSFSTPDETTSSFYPSLFTSLHALFAVMLSSLPFWKPILDSMAVQPHFVGETTRGYALSGTKGSGKSGPSRRGTPGGTVTSNGSEARHSRLGRRWRKSPEEKEQKREREELREAELRSGGINVTVDFAVSREGPESRTVTPGTRGTEESGAEDTYTVRDGSLEGILGGEREADVGKGKEVELDLGDEKERGRQAQLVRTRRAALEDFEEEKRERERSRRGLVEEEMGWGRGRESRFGEALGVDTSMRVKG